KRVRHDGGDLGGDRLGGGDSSPSGRGDARSQARVDRGTVSGSGALCRHVPGQVGRGDTDRPLHRRLGWIPPPEHCALALAPSSDGRSGAAIFAGFFAAESIARLMASRAVVALPLAASSADMSGAGIFAAFPAEMMLLILLMSAWTLAFAASSALRSGPGIFAGLVEAIAWPSTSVNSAG